MGVVGARHAEKLGQPGEKEPGIGALAGRGIGPTGDETVGGSLSFRSDHGRRVAKDARGGKARGIRDWGDWGTADGRAAQSGTRAAGAPPAASRAKFTL